MTRRYTLASMSMSVTWALAVVGLQIGAAAASRVAPVPDKKAAGAHYERAAAALAAQDPRAAIRSLGQCLRADAKSCACLRAMGTAHLDPKVKNPDKSVTYLQSYVDHCPDEKDVALVLETLSRQAPRTPQGLDRCESGLQPVGDLPARVGETIRYRVEINGISMGVVDVKIVRRGRFESDSVIEYRSTFSVDSLVSTFVPLRGQAASFMPVNDYVPRRSMTRFNVREKSISEDIAFDAHGKGLVSEQTIDGEARRRQRGYPTRTVDMLGAFYGLRALPRDAKGCATFFGSGRAHTVWLERDAEELVETPAGRKPADRYHLRYASETSRKVHEAHIWISQGKERLPYKAVVEGPDRLELNVHLYESGEAATAAP